MIILCSCKRNHCTKYYKNDYTLACNWVQFESTGTKYVNADRIDQDKLETYVMKDKLLFTTTYPITQDTINCSYGISDDICCCIEHDMSCISVNNTKLVHKIV